MAPLLGRWLVMDDDTPVALLDDLVAPGINIASCAGRHTGFIVRSVVYEVVNVVGVRGLHGTGPPLDRPLLCDLLAHE